MALLEGDQVVYVAQQPSPHAMRMFTEVGRRANLHDTGVGKAILATLSDADIRGIVGRVGCRCRRRRAMAPSSLCLPTSPRSATRGYSIDDEEQELGRPVLCRHGARCSLADGPVGVRPAVPGRRGIRRARRSGAPECRRRDRRRPPQVSRPSDPWPFDRLRARSVSGQPMIRLARGRRVGAHLRRAQPQPDQRLGDGDRGRHAVHHRHPGPVRTFSSSSAIPPQPRQITSAWSWVTAALGRLDDGLTAGRDRTPAPAPPSRSPVPRHIAGPGRPP